EKGEADQALQVLRRAAGREGLASDPDLVVTLGAALLERGEATEGIRRLSQRWMPGAAENVLLGLVRQQRGQDSAALSALAHARAIASGEIEERPDGAPVVRGIKWPTARSSEPGQPFLEGVALVARQVEQAMRALERRLPDVLAGKAQLTSAERWELIRI